MPLPAARATLQLPIPPGTMLVFTLGVTAVTHSPSKRARKNCALSSTGRDRSTTQAGETAATKSWLPANETQDSTLHDPTEETSAVST
jgi:hypothetical protein